MSDPTDSELSVRLSALYNAGEYAKVLAEASQRWMRTDASLDRSAGLGECCRLASLASRALQGNSTEPVPQFAPGAVWRVRALSAFVESHFSSGVAMLLVQDFFEAVIDRTAADQVLTEMARLSQPHDEPFCTVLLLRRLVAEKRGFLLWYHHDFPASIISYDEAIACAAEDNDSRGVLKGQLGRALSVYCASSTGAADRSASVHWTEDAITTMVEAGMGGYVLKAATHNLALMTASQKDGLRPYEMV